MKVSCDDKESLQKSMAIFNKDNTYANFTENAFITSAFVSMAIQFETVLSALLPAEDAKHIFYHRISVIQL